MTLTSIKFQPYPNQLIKVPSVYGSIPGNTGTGGTTGTGTGTGTGGSTTTTTEVGEDGNGNSVEISTPTSKNNNRNGGSIIIPTSDPDHVTTQVDWLLRGLPEAYEDDIPDEEEVRRLLQVGAGGRQGDCWCRYFYTINQYCWCLLVFGVVY